MYEEALSSFAHLCKLVVATRINKVFEADVSMPALDDKFVPLYISQTYSQPKDELTFDYCFFGNKILMKTNPGFVPTKLFEMYPKHPEMQYLETI